MKKYLPILFLLMIAHNIYANTLSTVELYNEDFKNATVEWLELGDWSFNIEPTITANRLRPQFGITSTALVESSEAFSAIYSEVYATVTYRVKKSNNDENGIKFYIDDNTLLSISNAKLIESSFTDDNKWRTITYKLSKEEMSRNAIAIKFFISTLNPSVEIDKVSILANPIGTVLQSNFIAKNTFLSTSDTLRLTDLSTGGPTSWTYTIQDSFDENNSVQLTTNDVVYPLHSLTNGIYDVSLEVANNSETSDTLKTRYITIGCPEVITSEDLDNISEVTFSQDGIDLFSAEYDLIHGASQSIIDLTHDFSLAASSDITVTVTLNNLKDDLLTNPLLYLWFGFYDDVSDFSDDATKIPLIVDIENASAKGTLTFTTEASSTPGNLLMRLKLASSEDEISDACSAINTGDMATFALNCIHNSITTYLGNAIKFTGNGYLKTSTENRIYTEPLEAFTICGWTKRATSEDFIIFAQGQDENSTYSFKLMYEDHGLTFYYDNVALLHLIDKNYSKKEDYHHYAVVGTGTEIQLYVDGTLRLSTETQSPYFPNANNDTYTQIGSNEFLGNLEGTRFWKVARSQEQLTEGWYRTLENDSLGLISYFQYNYATLNNASVVHDWHGLKHADIIGEVEVEKSFAPFLFSPITETSESSTAVYADIFDPSNWSWHPTEMPGSHSKAILDNNTKMVINTSNTVPTFSSIELTPGSQVTIGENSSLSIKDSIIFRYTYEAPASFLGLNNLIDDTVDVLVDATYAKGRNWYTGIIAEDLSFKDFPGILYNGTNASEAGYTVNEWDPKKGWVQITDENTMVEPLKGYVLNINPANSSHFRYKGKVTNVDHQQILLKGKGWHMVSNPFWAYLDLDELVNGNQPGSKYFKDGTKESDPTFGSHFTVWTTLGDNERYYAKYNATKGVTTGVPSEEWSEPLVAPGQAFFVFLSKDSATFRVDRAMLRQPSGENPILKSVSNTEPIRITASNNYGSYDCAISFHYDGELTYSNIDTPYEKASNNGSIPLIYSLKESTNESTEAVSINILPENEEEIIIPIQLDINNQSSGLVDISFSGLDRTDYTAYFEVNNQDNRVTDGSSISINTTALQTDIYYLKLKKLSTLLEDSTSSDLKYTVFANKNMVTIKNNTSDIENYSVSVYTSNGKRVYSLISNKNQMNFTLKNPGLYLIHMSDSKTTEIQKVIIQ